MFDDIPHRIACYTFANAAFNANADISFLFAPIEQYEDVSVIGEISAPGFLYFLWACLLFKYFFALLAQRILIDCNQFLVS